MKNTKYSSTITTTLLGLITLTLLWLGIGLSPLNLTTGDDTGAEDTAAAESYFNEARLGPDSKTAAAVAAIAEAERLAAEAAAADAAVTNAVSKIAPGSKVTVSGSHIAVSAPPATPPLVAPPAGTPTPVPEVYDSKIGTVAVYTNLYSLISFLSALPINQDVTHQFRSDADIASICRSEAAAACIELVSSVVYLKSSAMSTAAIDTTDMSIDDAAVVRVLQQFYTMRYDHAIKHEYCHAMLYKLGGYEAARNEHAAESSSVIVLGAVDYGTLRITDTVTGRRYSVAFIPADGYGRTSASDALVRRLFTEAGLI